MTTPVNHAKEPLEAGENRSAPGQSFKKAAQADWLKLDFLQGVELLSLGEPVPKGSIHKARLAKGTRIPAHTHPGDEYVYVLDGQTETGGVLCHGGDFWKVPANTRQGPHVAITDVEILTIRLGDMGRFEKD